MRHSRARCGVPLLLILAALPPAAAAAPAAAPSARPTMLLDEAFPLEAAVSLPAALLHWLDSLAQLDIVGATSGKTVRAYAREYQSLHGRFSDHDNEMLGQFAVLRSHAAERGPGEPHRLTEAFFGAATIEEALARSRPLLEPNEVTQLDAILRHFEGRYGEIWRDGQVARDFLARARGDAEVLAALETFLADVARFFGASIDTTARPRLVLAPVPGGYGTHAQAVGRYLLIEIRADDTLVSQIAPIVHEATHYLFYRSSSAREADLARVLAATGRIGEHAWHLMHEALPTAIAQGVADQRFARDRWDQTQRWYHIHDVDVFAKRLFPLVKEALATGRRFDGEFLYQAVSLYQPPVPRR